MDIKKASPLLAATRDVLRTLPFSSATSMLLEIRDVKLLSSSCKTPPHGNGQSLMRTGNTIIRFSRAASPYKAATASKTRRTRRVTQKGHRPLKLLPQQNLVLTDLNKNSACQLEGRSYCCLVKGQYTSHLPPLQTEPPLTQAQEAQ